MNEELVERHYKIFGRVQLVMFRDFSKRKAKELGLCGFVQNKNDSSVFIIAQGSAGQLAEYEKYLERGPLFAKVERVEKTENEINKKFDTFEIVYE